MTQIEKSAGSSAVGVKGERPVVVRTVGMSGSVGIVVVALVLVVGIPMGLVVVRWNQAAMDAPGKIGGAMTQFAADVMRPKMSVNEIVFASLSDLHKEAKLSVLTTTVDVDVTREEGSSSWGMYWGTNVARVAVRGARVQYVIDLNGMGTSDFVYSDSTKTLTVLVPRPRLDTEMIGIDPAKIETLDLRGGYLRWDKQETKERAIAELKPKVIIQANAPIAKKEAEAAGKEAMERFLSPLAGNLKSEGVKVEVAYRGE